MQLDPTISLSQQLREVPGNRLECLTSAAFASVGYTVFRNLFIELDGERVAETDVFASVFTPLRESRVMVECKGGHPKFDEIRKFASLNALLNPSPDELLIISRPGCPNNRIKLANLLRVRVVERTNLTYYLLPLMGGHALRQNRASSLNRYLAWQTVHEYLIPHVGQHQQMRSHYRCLVSELWKINDAQEQVRRSQEIYMNDFNNTCAAVSQARGTTANKALHSAIDDVIETAMYVDLLHRILNVYAIIRWTVQLVNHFTPLHLVINTGANLRAAIAELSAYPRYLTGFPSFLQTFFFVWGGFLHLPDRDYEISQMATEAGTTIAAIELYLKVLDQIFTGLGTSMFSSTGNIHFFKYVPAAFRALGGLHRQAIDSSLYSGRRFFPEDRVYKIALDRALINTGGIASLRY